jgi:hypothetical protein
VGGEIEIDIGGHTATLTVADFEVSATLWTVIVSACCEATEAGAVYNPPLLKVPTPVGLIDHVTALLLAPVTVAVYCWVWPPLSVTVPGETEIPTGTSLSVTDACFVPSA